jgi:micrococcal nuclease
MITILLTCFSLISFAEEIKGKVTSVIDGNTIEILTRDQETYKVLLHGIDSPEPGQHFAEQARNFLENLLLNKSVVIELRGKDRLGNRLGEIHVEGTPDPRHELLKAGLAWTTEPVAELEELKERARTQGKGLWQDEHPTPPWLYRRQQSMLQAKSS